MKHMQITKLKSTGALILAMTGCLTALAEAQQDAPSETPSIRLQSIFTGDKEQPAVSYFMPWQGTRTPDKLQWNIENKYDSTLQPIDRDVMRRSIHIYQEMNLENN